MYGAARRKFRLGVTAAEIPLTRGALRSNLRGVFTPGLIALALLTAAGLSIVWSTLRLGISPMPTSPAVRAEVLALVPATLEGEVHELGAGWGTLAWPLSAALPGARIVAWEASPVPFAFCWLRLRVQRRANLELRFGDFLGADLREASLVVAYLWTGGMTALAPKFDAELPVGAQVISHTFAWRGREPEVTRQAHDLYRTPVYRYRVGAKAGPGHHVAVSVTPVKSS